MLTPEYIDNIPGRLLKLYQELEERIIQDMARRIAISGEVIPTTQWQMWKLQQMGEEREYIQQQLSRLTGKTQQELSAIFEEAGEEAIAFDDAIYQEAGLTPTKLMESSTLKGVIQSGMRKTNQLFYNMTETTANTATMQFENALDAAWLDITSGAFSYQNAITSAVKNLAGAGIDAIIYPSGHTDKIDVAVRRAVLTGVNQAAGELSMARADEMDCDLVETTAHMGARLSHTYWQGRVFSRSGKSRKYPDFISSTGYGTGPGLCGWNCRHSFFPYFEGISERLYTQKQLNDMNRKEITYNGVKMTLYEASQDQRYIERNIRKWKREYIGLSAAGLDTTKASVKLSQWNGRLTDFLDQTGLQKDYARIQVLGFGRSQAGRATAQAKKELKEQTERGIISLQGGKTMHILPNAEKAEILKEKFTEYALNPEKDYNKATAFEKALGYNQMNVDKLIDNIYRNVKNFDAVKKPDNGYGQRYSVLMSLVGENGKKANVQTAWIVDKKSGITRLISAYITSKKVKE